jgi:hypothetical protein
MQEVSKVITENGAWGVKDGLRSRRKAAGWDDDFLASLVTA